MYRLERQKMSGTLTASQVKPGVESVSELKRRNPESLHEMMAKINLKRNIVDRMPSLKRVSKWIDDSKDIEIKVSS